jgi:prepilin-type N-terminal cleavage/methylation domain-containing protein
MTFQQDPGKRGFSLTELLAALGIVGFLATLGAVAWLMLARSHDRQASVTAVMGILEQGRASALATRSDVWVLFGRNGSREGLVTLRRDGTNFESGNWAYLAPGTSFAAGESSAVTQPVPEPLLSRIQKPGVSVSGGVMFQPNGRIPVQSGGAGQLSISLAGSSVSTPVTRLLLSRATGRATLR